MNPGMLNIQLASDLHLEFPDNRQFIRENPLKPLGSVLVLAGDVVPFSAMELSRDFFSYVADHFEQTYWLPGNHEYYHFDLADKQGKLEEKIRSNVTLVNNIALMHQGVHLVFSTLWSQISRAGALQIENRLNDFHLIRFKGERFNVERYNALHRESMDFIRESIRELKGENTAVFTHHCPTFQHYPEQYRGSILNEAFAVELFDFIETSNVAYWGYGHHHGTVPDFYIGNTCMVTNQLGYVQRHEHEYFNTGKVLVL